MNLTEIYCKIHKKVRKKYIKTVKYEGRGNSNDERHMADSTEYEIVKEGKI